MIHKVKNPSGDECGTPEKYIGLVKEVLGTISLDPCTTSEFNEVVGAEKYYTKEDNALRKNWLASTVYVNPPYSRKLMPLFVDKVIREYVNRNIHEVIVLTNIQGSSKWYQSLMTYCDSFCMPNHRIQFNGKKNNWYSQTFFYFGENEERFFDVFSKIGVVK